MQGSKCTASKRKYKNVPSLFEEIQENERDLLTGVVDDTHEQFIQAVLEGRPGLEESRVHRAADGRVFSGKQAFEAGLVDELGGYASVVRRLSENSDFLPTRRCSNSILKIQTFPDYWDWPHWSVG